jgi:hypothetical protein
MFGAIANAPYTGPSNASGEQQMLPPLAPTATAFGSNHDSSDEDANPPPTTPIRPSSTASSTSISKRKYSALDDSTSGSIRTTSTGSYGKRQRNFAPNGTVALHGIGDALRDLHGAVRDGPLSQPPRRQRRSSAERRIEATTLLQNTETLTAEQVIAFADLFEQNTARADTYMALVRADVRKLWVQKQLTQMGFPDLEAVDD